MRLPIRPLGVEERSDEAPRAGGAVAPRAPDPEVVAKPTRRRFSAEYRLRILEEADRCTQPGEIGRLLRREGLYSSHLSVWRKARRNGSLKALTPKKRGAKPAESNPLSGKVRQLEAKVTRLEKELGVDPVWWTPDPLRRRSPQCHNQDHPMRRSSGSR